MKKKTKKKIMDKIKELENKKKDFGEGGRLDKLNVTVRMSNGPAKADGKDDEPLKYCAFTMYRPNCYKAIGKSLNELAPGIYAVKKDYGMGGSYFEELKVQTDSLVAPKGGLLDEILTDIGNFWKKEDRFNELGFTYYRGYLFYGAHGGGKSCLVNLISKGVIDNGGLVFVCQSPEDFIDGINIFRQVESNRKIVCIFEDIDAIIKEWGEEQILAYLDGEYKISNVLNIATTNYPELLDKRLVSRPRRFDRVIKIDYPDAELRKIYFGTKIDKGEVKQWVKLTDGLSFAALAELVISVKALGKDLEETLVLLRDLQDREESSSDYKGGVGFKSGSDSPSSLDSEY